MSSLSQISLPIVTSVSLSALDSVSLSVSALDSVSQQVGTSSWEAVRTQRQSNGVYNADDLKTTILVGGSISQEYLGFYLVLHPLPS